MSKFARQLQFAVALPCLGILMISTTNDLSRSNLHHLSSPGSATPGSAGASLPEPIQPQPLNAGLADLKRLSQSLKPRRQAAAGTAEQTHRNLEQPVEHARRHAKEQFSMPARLVPLPDLPARRPVGLDNISSMKRHSRQLLEQMAGPSARALLVSSLFQSPVTPR